MDAPRQAEGGERDEGGDRCGVQRIWNPLPMPFLPPAMQAMGGPEFEDSLLPENKECPSRFLS